MMTYDLQNCKSIHDWSGNGTSFLSLWFEAYYAVAMEGLATVDYSGCPTEYQRLAGEPISTIRRRPVQDRSPSHEMGEDDAAGQHTTIKFVDHAPSTSHGTYLAESKDVLEPLEDYQDGGYHPVYLGDSSGADGRYHVLHKLGHGGFGAVWLCRDAQRSRYVALKTMTSDVASEELIELTLERLDQSMPGAEYVATPLDHFSVEGPNGTHQCIVLPVLGPCVSPDLWMWMEQDPDTVLRGMARQATEALNFLHKSNICHGGSSLLLLSGCFVTAR